MAISPPLTDNSAELFSSSAKTAQQFSRDHQSVQQRSSASQERSSASSAADLELVGCLRKERKEKQIVISCGEESAHYLIVVLAI
jgi:hypothetical protein